MAALIWSPFADKGQAKKIARTLLNEQLIVCANLFEIDSLFQWRGEVQEGCECGALFKTKAELLDQAVLRLEALHPYEAPAIFGWKCDQTGAATRAWLRTLTPSRE